MKKLPTILLWILGTIVMLVLGLSPEIGLYLNRPGKPSGEGSTSRSYRDRSILDATTTVTPRKGFPGHLFRSAIDEATDNVINAATEAYSRKLYGGAGGGGYSRSSSNMYPSEAGIRIDQMHALQDIRDSLRRIENRMVQSATTPIPETSTYYYSLDPRYATNTVCKEEPR